MINIKKTKVNCYNDKITIDFYGSGTPKVGSRFVVIF